MFKTKITWWPIWISVPKKKSDFLALNDLLNQSQPNQTWWEWPAKSVVHIFDQHFMAAILDFCTKVKMLTFASKLHQSQPNQTWWEWPASFNQYFN